MSEEEKACLEKGLYARKDNKIYVTQDRQVLNGDEAERRLSENNDTSYLSEDGIIRVPRERWEIAQKFEHDTWMTDCLGANDDRNLDHMQYFGDYAVLAGKSFGRVLELGCGPFTNLRLILPLLVSTPHVTLLDPLINDYMKHPNCTYRHSQLCGIPVETVALPIEEFKPAVPYDLVVISNVLEHCYDIPRIFEVVLSCLAPACMLVFTDNVFDLAQVKDVALNTYDAGHPLRVAEPLITSFLEANFEPIHQRRLIGLYGQANRIDLYYIGIRKAQETPIIHFVYSGNPLNDDSISAPETITNHLYRFLEQRTRVKYYDLEDTTTPVLVDPRDIVIGHPHPNSGTILERLFQEKCSGRFLLWPFHSRLPETNRYALMPAAQANKLFAISGPYWTDTIAVTEFACWQDKLVRLDNAIDTLRFQFLKTTLNPPGRRGLFVFGRSGPEKGTAELFSTLLDVPGQVVIAGVYNEQDLAIIKNRPDTIMLGQLSWRDRYQVETILDRCDFFVNMSISDASPTTLLECMAIGLVPVTTPQCGYYYPSFLLLTLDSHEHNILTLKNVQQIPELQLRAMQAENRRIVEEKHTWSGFCETIWREIGPSLGIYVDQANHSATQSAARRIKVAGEVATEHDLTAVGDESLFARSIAELFASVRPKIIIETGTYLGEGTTQIIANALQMLEITDAAFYTIECNPDHFHQAQANLARLGLIDRIYMLHGLSVPRSILPTIQQIEQNCVNNIEFDDIYIDHQEQQRALLYYKETDFSGVEDDLLGKVLDIYGNRPDFVLLDSGGHMGNVEFNYLVSRLKGPCYLALDDIFHIKHHKSFKQMQGDPHFEIITVSKEKFGFCLAKFTPDPQPLHKDINRIIWFRPDSIGDNILAASMLPHIRKKYAAAHVTVVCRDHIAGIYEACPFVDEIISFDHSKIIADKTYQNEIIAKLRELKVDLLLNSVYSREAITDAIALSCGAKTTIALDGDCSNITNQEREINNKQYTFIIPSPEECCLELDRHRDFLKGIGIDSADLALSFDLKDSDTDAAEKIFTMHGLIPEKTIVLFAGAQHDIRLYDQYGGALAELCKEHDLSVIALGTANDFIINQNNLKATGVRTLNLSGKLSLQLSAAIINRCRLAVGAETGLAHIACAVGTPNVILLGGGHFGRFMPYSPLTSVVCLPLECYGCNWRCKYLLPYCIKGISTEVLQKALEMALAQESEYPRIFVQSIEQWQPPLHGPMWRQMTKYFTPLKVKNIPI